MGAGVSSAQRLSTGLTQTASTTQKLSGGLTRTASTTQKLSGGLKKTAGTTRKLSGGLKKTAGASRVAGSGLDVATEATQKLTKRVDEATIALQRFLREFHKLRGGGAANTTQKLSGGLKLVAGTAQKADKEIKKIPQTIKLLPPKLEEVSKTTKKAFNTQPLKNYQGKLASIGTQLDKNGRLRDIKTGRFVAAPGGAASRQSRFARLKQSFQGNTTGNTQALAAGATLILGVNEAAKLSDKIGDVRRNTLMSKTEFAGLKKELDSFDTRTSTASLLDIAKTGGKLGVPKRELAEFTRVVDMANVGLGDEFGGNASLVAEKLGTVKNLFAQTKNMQYGEAMMKIGSSTNALGKQGKNSAPNVLEFATRLGQLGKMAPKLSKSLALGAVLEEGGLSAEIAAGGVTDLIKLMGQRPKVFAKTLELTNTQFKQMFNNNPGALIERLAARFKGVDNDVITKTLQAMGSGSQETIKVVNTLSNKLPEYKSRLRTVSEQMKKATDLGVDYNIMNQTMAARLDKAKKAGISLLVTLGNKLSPALDFLTEKFKQAAKFIQNNWDSIKPVLFGVGVALALVTIKMIALNIAMAANPVGAIITGIALLSAGIYAAYQRFKPFRGVVNSTWQDLKNFADGIRQDFTPALNDIKNAFGGAGNSAFGWGEIVGLVGLAVRGVINRLLIILKGFTTFFAVMIDGIIATAKFWYHAFAGIFALITGDVTGFKQYFNRAIGAVGDFFVRTFQKVKRFFGGFISGFVDRMGQALEIVGLVDSKQRELATKKTRDFFGLDEQKKKATTPQPGGLVKASAQNKKSPLAGTLNSFAFDIPEAQKKVVKATRDKLAANTLKLPGFKNNLANLLDQGRSKSRSSDLGGGVEKVEGVARQRNVYINFKSFVEGGFNITTNNIGEAADQTKEAFLNMFSQVINSANDAI